jgi:hypothetical protein
MEGLAFNHVMTNNSEAIYEFVRHSATIAYGGAISQRSNDSNDLISVPLSTPRFSGRTIQVLTIPKRTLPASLQPFIETLIDCLKAVN